jgi:hypothetical protein
MLPGPVPASPAAGSDGGIEVDAPVEPLSDGGAPVDAPVDAPLDAPLDVPLAAEGTPLVVPPGLAPSPAPQAQTHMPIHRDHVDFFIVFSRGPSRAGGGRVAVGRRTYDAEARAVGNGSRNCPPTRINILESSARHPSLMVHDRFVAPARPRERMGRRVCATGSPLAPNPRLMRRLRPPAAPISRDGALGMPAGTGGLTFRGVR